MEVCTHLIISDVVLADELLDLCRRQDPADIEENVDIGGCSLRDESYSARPGRHLGGYGVYLPF